MPAKRRILIVDDSREIVEGLRSYFEPLFAVLAAHSERDALQLLKQCGEPVDLVITDLPLPGISGVALARTIKVRCPHMQLIAMTGWGHQQEQLARDSRADAVLSKQFDLKELHAEVDRLLGRRDS